MNTTEVYELFPTEEDCVAYLERIRWQGNPRCPYCQSNRVTSRSAKRRYQCNGCNTTFSATVGTPFHHTHLPLQKWFVAISLIINARKGFSARQLTRDLDINKNTAWYLATRVSRAMMEPSQRDLLQKIDLDLFDATDPRALGVEA